MRQEERKHTESADAEKTVELKKLVKYVEGLFIFPSFHANIVNRDRTATQLQLISDLCDATVPSSALGLANFDDGIVGLAGTTSSLIGLTAQWAKTE